MEGSGEQVVLLLDFENTLVTRDYQEYAHVTHQVLLETLTALSPPQLAECGLIRVAESGAYSSEEARQEFHTIYCKSFVERLTSLRQLEELECDPSLESILYDLFVSSRVLSSAFVLASPIHEAALRSLALRIASDERSLIAGYRLLPGCKQQLEEAMHTAPDNELIFAVCATSPLRVVQQTLKALGIAPLFDRLLCHGQPGYRKSKEETWRLARTAFGAFQNYQLCVVGDMLDTDISSARECHLRSLWFDAVPWSVARNNLAFHQQRDYTRLDLAFTDWTQLSGLLGLLKQR